MLSQRITVKIGKNS